MTGFIPNVEQSKVIENRTGHQIVIAGAGSGKTATMVEQLGRCITEDGKSLDSIVSITFTEKAANELKSRIRSWLISKGKHAEACSVEASDISTIHGFCLRLVKQHSLRLGLDPNLAVLDEIKANILKRDALAKAAEEFIGSDSPLGPPAEKIRLANFYDLNPGGNLAKSIIDLADVLRGRGMAKPDLPAIEVKPVTKADLTAVVGLLNQALVLSKEGKPSKTKDDEISRFNEALSLLNELTEIPELQPGEVSRLLKVNLGTGSQEYKEVKRQIKSLMKELVGRLNDAEAIADYEFIRELFGMYVTHYAALKESGGYVDFDDLQLYACQLLQENEGIRQALSDRICLLQVDEFQDTNPLQARILDLIKPKNLCVVGDRNQSIYSFRHADVSLFDQFAEKSRNVGQINFLSTNYRSNAKILSFLNHIFSSESFFGDKYVDLKVKPDDPQEDEIGNAVIELLAIETDPEDGKVNLQQAREFEAGLIVEKMVRLQRERLVPFGEMALLLTKLTNLDIYEKALQQQNIPYHVGGRHYFARSEVRDINCFLKILANPLDDLSFASVMRSPFVGLSDEALFILASIRKTNENVKSLYEAVKSSGQSRFSKDDQVRLSEFSKTCDTLFEDKSKVSLSELIELIVSRTGYDLAILSMPHQSEAVFANIRKLIRQAGNYQQLYGTDLRGFTDYIDEAKVLAVKEGSAQIEDEESDSVKIMTVHGAKGLQFGYVFVADLLNTFESRSSHGTEIPAITYVPDDHLPYGGLGFRFRRSFGDKVNVFDYDSNAEARNEMEIREQKRVLYVAMSRAKKGLFISGGILGKAKKSRIESLLAQLSFDSDELFSKGKAQAVAGEFPVDLLYYKPHNLKSAQGHDLITRTTEKTDFSSLRLIEEHYCGKPPVISRISASSLENFIDCPAKFYFKDMLGINSWHTVKSFGKVPQKRLWSQADYGNIAHFLLFSTDWRNFKQPGKADIIACAQRFLEAGEEDLDELAESLSTDISNLAASRVGRQLIEADKIEKEIPFSFCLNDVVLHGFIDVLIDRNVVVDYKTGKQAAGADYSLQTDLYSLAILKSGAGEVVSKIIFLHNPDNPMIARYTQNNVIALESRLIELIDNINSSDFSPAKQISHFVCSDCPGYGTTCSM